ncbi:MAG: EAL domain-containing protein [Pseudomonadota bacterium]
MAEDSGKGPEERTVRRTKNGGGASPRLPKRKALSAENFQEIVAQIPACTNDLIMMIDKSGRVVWMNDAMKLRTEAQGTVPAEHVSDWILSQVEQIDEGTRKPAAVTATTEVSDDDVIMLNDKNGRQEWYLVTTLRIEARGETFKVATLTDVTAVKHREQNLVEANTMAEHRLNHDLATGLPNRRKFSVLLQSALRKQTEEHRAGLILVELEQFRELNNIHGPAAASEVIQELCVTLMENLPEDQVICRTDSREFAVIFTELASQEALVAKADQLHEALQISVPMDAGEFKISVRLGVVFGDPELIDPDKMLMDAQVAMYHPETPQNVFVRVYDPEMRKLLENRTQVYGELQAAIQGDEIEPFFQPQILLEDARVTGFEVLARWRHPKRGLVPPGMFLGIAEETGLLPTIDDIIMVKAFEALAAWRDMGFGGLRLSLNASGFALRDVEFVDRLQIQLEKYGLTSAAVSIEILENVLIEDEEDIALQTLKQLKQSGFHMELDDFGTGYASISTLITLDVDTVKLDRSLVKDLLTNDDSKLIVESTLLLTNRLGLEALAEGIEDSDQLEMLRGMGCHAGQGYGIAKPMSRADMSAWLEQNCGKSESKQAVA